MTSFFSPLVNFLNPILTPAIGLMVIFTLSALALFNKARPKQRDDLLSKTLKNHDNQLSKVINWTCCFAFFTVAPSYIVLHGVEGFTSVMTPLLAIILPLFSVSILGSKMTYLGINKVIGKVMTNSSLTMDVEGYVWEKTLLKSQRRAKASKWGTNYVYKFDDPKKTYSEMTLMLLLNEAKILSYKKADEKAFRHNVKSLLG